jgi:hypothetical protein
LALDLEIWMRGELSLDGTGLLTTRRQASWEIILEFENSCPKRRRCVKMTMKIK